MTRGDKAISHVRPRQRGRREGPKPPKRERFLLHFQRIAQRSMSSSPSPCATSVACTNLFVVAGL
jgi:hypothetical protein